MNWMELKVDVECPKCGKTSYETAEFNTMHGDEGGINSGWYEHRCWDCDKKFYWNGRVNFDTEVNDVVTRKPRGVK